jgi:transcriptional regulator with AAA-type ATPase domain/tetratricopeptide (TPR) repeat protein
MNPLRELLGESAAIGAVREKVERLLQRQRDARRLPPVLIQGETGTGKGLLARVLHRAGPRADGPFVDVNCAAIPETLLEAEMFGYERGAFTDARRSKPGLLQTAHRGTIFLDEVALLPEALQAKFLKVLEERSVRRLGSTRDEPVDVWIVTASNEDLRRAATERRFREDLYHRLAVLTLQLPPLRDRGSDVIRLAEHFLARACADYGVAGKTLTEDARRRLLSYRWPGNVRELANVMERVALLEVETEITADALGITEMAPAETRTAAAPDAEDAGGLDEVVRARVVEVLLRTGWNISRASALLGISRNTLRARIEKYGLEAPARPSPAARGRSPAPPAPSPTPSVAPSPGPLRWERRPVTLLRITLTDEADPEVPADTGRGFDIALDKIRTFGGRVEAVSLTGVVAAFGVDPLEQAPDRAGHAAMAIQRAFERARETGSRLPVLRQGIHFGHFVVGQGSGALELAEEAKAPARAVLEQIMERAEAQAVVVSDHAATVLERGFDLIELGARAGVTTPVFALVGLARGQARLVATFVGRHRELELLWSQIESALRGAGQIVGVGGEPGIGKSRLLFEFKQSLAGKALHYLEGHCHAYAASMPFTPVVDIVKAVCALGDSDTPETMVEKVNAVAARARLDTDAGGSLLHLLGVKEAAGPFAAMEPEAVKKRIFDAVRQLLVTLCEDCALVIVLEDVHWIDRTSEEFFASLADTVPTTRMLLVSTYRPGYRPPWIERSYATQVALQPLAPEDSLRVLRAALRRDDVADTLAGAIAAKAEGNPFFLEELARAVRDQPEPEVTLGVPDTVHGVLLGRIDALAAEDRQLLQMAAVVGKRVPFAVIAAVADISEGDLRQGFARLKAAEFLYEATAAGAPEYAFRHTLTHEVAYASVLDDTRRRLHRRIVDAMETLYAGRRHEYVERLADHAFAGQAWAKAAPYLREAGQKAFNSAAYREAVAHFERALDAMKQLPEGDNTIRDAIDVRFELRNALQPIAAFAAIVDRLREAERLAQALGDQRRLGRVYAYLTDYFRLAGDTVRAIESGERALAIADALDDFGLKVSTRTYLGQAYYARGEYRRATAFFRMNVELLADDLARERFGLPQFPSIHSRTCLVWCLAELGEFAEGRRRGEEAIHIAESSAQPLGRTVATSGIGILYLQQGELQDAISALERGVELSQTWRIPLWWPRVATGLGAAYVLAGRGAEALPLLEQAAERAAAMQFVGGQSWSMLWLAEAYLGAGRGSDARRVATRGLELATHHGHHGYEAYLRRFLGELALRVDPVDVEGARHELGAALELAERLEMKPLVAHCRLSLARVAEKAGRATEASEQRASAVELFARLGMRWWLDRAAEEGRSAA